MTNAKPIAFLLGSGFSFDLSSIPVLRGLSKETIKYISDNAASDLHPFPSLMTHLKALPEPILDDVERLLTMYRGDNPWLARSYSAIRNGFYEEISKAVTEVIKERQKERPLKQPASDQMEDLVRFWQNNLSNVVTFNYDTLIEQFAVQALSNDQNHLGPAEIYEGPIANLANRFSPYWKAHPGKFFNLIKLHGSTNWFYSGNRSFASETIYFDPLFPVKHPGTALTASNQEDLIELLVPPLLDKDPYMQHPLLRHLWNSAYRAFFRASDIYVVGYSLPVTDLTAKFMLTECGHSSKAKWHVLQHESTCDSEFQTRFKDTFKQVKFYPVSSKESSIEKLMTLLRDHGHVRQGK